jgi:hypothetical protein
VTPLRREVEPALRDNRRVIPSKLRRLPREAIAPGLDVDDGDKRIRRARSVLVLAELPIFERIRMKERGGLLNHVADVAAAVAVLAEQHFDAAIIDMKAPGGGTELVKSIKAGVGSAGAPELEALARERHRLTPFYLVMEGESQYAIVVSPPEHSYLEDGKALRLADAVTSLDLGKLLLRGPAMA